MNKFEKFKGEFVKLGYGSGKDDIPDYEPRKISKSGLCIIFAILISIIFAAVLLNKFCVLAQ